MNRYDELTNEQKLIVLASRLTFSEKDESELKEIMQNDVDWFYILNITLKNKVLTLLWHNLSIRDYKMRNRTGDVAYSYYLANRERNKKYLSELSEVLSIMTSKGVTCVPLKGAFLIPYMYKDLGIRIMNDVDCIIKKSEIPKIRETMNEMGYYEGDYNPKEHKIDKISRRKDILWRTKMNNLHPFLKVQDSEYVKFTGIDFCHSLDLELDTAPVETMLTRTIKYKDDEYRTLNICDFFIHLCCHLYKEATNTMWVYRGSDINLIKFCDVREFILHFMNKETKKEAVDFAIKYNLQKAIYFTIYYLREIYNDGYEFEMLQSLNITDEGFLNNFGEKDYGESAVWKKTFWQRLFSISNEDELKEAPKYLEIRDS
ncbi:MAG: nucleotidyltransferase family protein [Defluviitaleaceae bacterium]|nr:nucleotidyltransferase family protein [Defluviitaleaceae bacterium]